jgi:uncharacterized protein YkwD
MNRSLGAALCGLVLSLATTSVTRADALSAVQLLRLGGCGGILPWAPPLNHNALLDRAAERWAAGRPISEATEHSGYQAETAVGLHVTGPDSSLVDLLRRSDCPTVMKKALHDIGVFHRGLDTWLVFAAAGGGPARPVPARTVPARPVPAPGVPASPRPADLTTRALQLVNGVRARGTLCGERQFAPVPPVKLSTTLASVASGHATDMAAHNYFEHEDLQGHSPAERVRAVGYAEKLVGENIAYGVASVDEAVQGWLDSPGHCENIMDPRFAEMGIGYAAGRASKRGLYWVQVLAEPRA